MAIRNKLVSSTRGPSLFVKTWRLETSDSKLVLRFLGYFIKSYHFQSPWKWKFHISFWKENNSVGVKTVILPRRHIALQCCPLSFAQPCSVVHCKLHRLAALFVTIYCSLSSTPPLHAVHCHLHRLCMLFIVIYTTFPCCSLQYCSLSCTLPWNTVRCHIWPYTTFPCCSLSSTPPFHTDHCYLHHHAVLFYIIYTTLQWSVDVCTVIHLHCCCRGLLVTERLRPTQMIIKSILRHRY